jgi:hypothetical protein
MGMMVLPSGKRSSFEMKALGVLQEPKEFPLGQLGYAQEALHGAEVDGGLNELISPVEMRCKRALSGMPYLRNLLRCGCWSGHR